MPQGQVLAPWQSSIEGASALLHMALPTSCLISPSCSCTDLLESPAPTACFSRSHSAHAALCLGFPSFFLWSICPNHKMKPRCCLFQEVFLAPPSCLLPDTPSCLCSQVDGVLLCVLPEGCLLRILEPCNYPQSLFALAAGILRGPF